MVSQPFDDYKNKGVEYDYILEAEVFAGTLPETTVTQIIDLLKNEDFLKIYFKDIALGRVYGKVVLKLDNKLYFKFGISLVDAETRPTTKDLINDINEFILALNKNVSEANLDIKEGDIKVDVITESKIDLNSIDKNLITEGNLVFNKEDTTHKFSLNDDGIVEHYIGEKLDNTFPFAKLTLTRECKTLIQDGYKITGKPLITEADFGNEDDNLKKDVLNNPEQVKQDIQNSIDQVDEIQAKQDELNDKLNNLLGEAKDVIPDFPSTEFTNEPIGYDDLNAEVFDDKLTAEQKAYINTYIGTMRELIEAVKALYEDIDDVLISLDTYVNEIVNPTDVLDDMSDLLDLKTESNKFYTVDKAFDDFLQRVKDDGENGELEFKISDVGLSKEDTAEFKNMLLSRNEIEDVTYDPQNNTYKVKLSNKSDTEKVEESKIEETQNLSRLYQHTKNKDTFAIIGSQDKDTKQDRSNELKSEIGKVQRQFSNVGYNKLEGTYTYENGEQGIENSFIIYNIPKNTALDIANKLNQESIIWKDNDYFGFIKADGTEESQFKNREKNMTFDEKITDMFGSRFKNGSNRLAFAFECKLIETTATGNNFSKQGKSNIVEYPICKIDVPKSECLEEDVDLNQFAEECMKKLQLFLTNNKLGGEDLVEENETFMQYIQQNNLEVQPIIPRKVFKVYDFDEEGTGGYIGKLMYTAQGIWTIEIAQFDE